MKEKNEDVNDLTGNIGINSVSLIGPSMINFDNENSIIYNQRKFSVTNLKNRNSSLHFNLRHNKTLAVKIPRLLTELSKIKMMKKKLNSRKK